MTDRLCPHCSQALPNLTASDVLQMEPSAWLELATILGLLAHYPLDQEPEAASAQQEAPGSKLDLARGGVVQDSDGNPVFRGPRRA